MLTGSRKGPISIRTILNSDVGDSMFVSVSGGGPPPPGRNIFINDVA